jgi:hypothetical protein
MKLYTDKYVKIPRLSRQNLGKPRPAWVSADGIAYHVSRHVSRTASLPKTHSGDTLAAFPPTEAQNEEIKP